MKMVNFYEPKVPYFTMFSEYPNEYLMFCHNPNNKTLLGCTNDFGIELYQDEEDENIIYNKIFHTVYDSPYFIVSSYNNKNGKMLKIQFVNTHTIATIKYSEFTRLNGMIDLVDPYELTLFNSNGCIGNIDYEPLGRKDPYAHMLDGPRYYEVWCDMMSRCFVPGSKRYTSYGAVGFQPFYYTWKCFKYFYIDMQKAFHNFNINFDANNHMLYSIGPRVLDLHYIMTSKLFPVPLNPYYRGRKPNNKSINILDQPRKLYSVVGPCKD